MKKRIFSGFLALAICLSLCSSAFASFVLLGLKDDAADRGWEFIDAQKEAMNAEQIARLTAAWDHYQEEAVQAEIDRIAGEVAEKLVTDEFMQYGLNLDENWADTGSENGQLEQLYQWKVMRDIMEGEIDFSIANDDYAAWLDDFVAFEQANDEAVSASAPTAALNQLGSYSDELTTYFQELADIYFKADASDISGNDVDVDKVDRYLRASVTAADQVDSLTAVGKEAVYTNDAKFLEALTADCVEVMKSVLLNLFDMEMQVSTFQIEGGILEELTDRNMKGGFLLVGETYARKVIDASSTIRDDIAAIDKGEVMEKLLEESAQSILSPNNAVAADSLYSTVKVLAAYVLNDVAYDLVEETVVMFGQSLDTIKTYIDYVNEAMYEVDNDHAIELIHINTYLGRVMLDPDVDTSVPVTEGTEDTIETKLTHSRYQAVADVLDKYYAKGTNLSQIDVLGTGDLGSEDGSKDPDTDKVAIDDEVIGKIVIDASDLTAGQSGTIEIYRGDAYNGTPDAMDVLRYMGEYNVEITAAEVPSEPDTEVPTEEPTEEPAITLDKDAIPETVAADGSIVIKGTTNLPYVVVAITLINGDEVETKYYNIISGDVFNGEGITVAVPEGAVAGYEYQVIVGADKVTDWDTFTIEGQTVSYKIDIGGDEDVKLGDTFTIQSTADSVVPAYVLVSITDTETNVTKYSVVYSAEELAAGITIALPEDAQVGSKYLVVVGTSEASAIKYITVIEAGEPSTEEPSEEPSEEYTIALEAIDDISIDADDKSFTIKTTADSVVPNYVLVAVTQTAADGTTKTIYAVVHSAADVANGITLELPEDAAVGDVYTVVVGTSAASGNTTFTVVETQEPTEEPTEEPTTEPTEYDPVLSGLDTLTVTRNKTKLYTGTGQNIPDGATVTFTATIADETYATIDEITTDDTNHVYVTVKGVKKGTTTMTITMQVVIDGVLYTRTKDVAVTVRTSSSGGGSSSGSSGSSSGSTTTDSVTITVGGDGDYEATVSSSQKITWTMTDESIAVLTSDPSDPNATFEGVSAGTTTLVGVITDAYGNVIETITLTIVVEEHKCEWPDIVGHWAHQTIDTMTINGYIKGYPDGLFRPDDNITRAEFSAIVYRILGLTVASDGVEYDDTPGHWAEDIIATMSLPEGYGMLRGYGDGNFGPNDAITREQAVAIIARAKSAIWTAAEDGARETFTDSDDISWWFDGEIDSAVTNGLITGYEDGSFKPLNNITRAEAAVMLSRAWPEVLD